MGGGGGSGHCADPRVAARGGAGGGVVFLRVGSMSGSGVVAVGGGSGGGCGGGGSGGGGAGGLLHLRAAGSVSCALLSVEGGVGADGNFGAGGGGAGGRVLAQGADFSGCSADVRAGVAGLGGFGASPEGVFSPGHFGDVTIVPGGFEGLEAPSIESPRSGALVGARPTVSGRGPADASVTLYVDGQPSATGASASDGAFSLELSTPLEPGQRRLQVAAAREGVWSPRSGPVLVVVTGDAEPTGRDGPGTRRLTVGLGCVTGGSLGETGL